uniref:Uncharacterized protein n=1 Tax=Rhizophora mucronata TaxID=61149 RepID=A0A2P2QZ24_RHIMU
MNKGSLRIWLYYVKIFQRTEFSWQLNMQIQ